MIGRFREKTKLQILLNPERLLIQQPQSNLCLINKIQEPIALAA